MTQQVALVTGANGDMGQGICACLAAAGWHVIASDIGPDGRGFYDYLPCDLADLGALRGMIAKVEQKSGPVRALVNNAGIWNGAHFFDITPESYDRTFDVNARAGFFATQIVTRRLIELKLTGAVVNIGSLVAEIGSQIIDYAGSKSAVSIFTKSLAKTLGPHGIRINTIAPGSIDTAMSRQPDPARRAEVAASIGLRRIGTPSEIGDAVAYLVSDRASYITGALLDVHGGWG